MSILRTALLVVLLSGLWGQAFCEEQHLVMPRFGAVHLYLPASPPKHVTLFISGDGGWNLGVVEMARSLAGLDSLVVGIDINHYLRSLARVEAGCNYAAADFEALSQQVQRRLGFKDYRRPVVVGYSSGATLAYAIAAEAPPGTFRGAISLGFSPDLPLSRPLCPGSGLHSEAVATGVSFAPDPGLETPWVILQGEIDKVWSARAAEGFVAQIPSAQVITLPKVGHGFSVQRHWFPQFKQTFLALADAREAGLPSDSALYGLPLVEVPAPREAPDTDYMALLLTGDGGWAGLDRNIAGALAGVGIPVVGLDSLKYFWKPRDAATTAFDLARIAVHYLAAWGKRRLVVVGYSFGADVLPFAVERLPADLKGQIGLMTLIGPDVTASFEFHFYDWLGVSDSGEPIMPVLQRLRGVPPTLCIHGAGEKRSLCRGLDPALARSIELKGAHHFNGDYPELARRILMELNR